MCGFMLILWLSRGWTRAVAVHQGEEHRDKGKGTEGRQQQPPNHGSTQRRILLATIAVFFLVYVAVSSGLRAASRKLLEMMSTFGGGRWQLLRYLEIPSAIPSFLSGLKISITAAMIGAVVGEWFGAPTGLGIVILNSMQNFQIPLMWAAILAVAAIALSGYGIAHFAERIISRRFS